MRINASLARESTLKISRQLGDIIKHRNPRKILTSRKEGDTLPGGGEIHG